MMGMRIGEVFKNGRINISLPMPQGMLPDFGLLEMHGFNPALEAFKSANETPSSHKVNVENSTGNIKMDSPTKEKCRDKKEEERCTKQ